MAWFSTSSGIIELEMTPEQAAAAYHQGPCDIDVRAASQIPEIAAQLAKIDPATLRDELDQYGAWSVEELSDHEQNLQRIVWLAAGDIVEGEAA